MITKKIHLPSILLIAGNGRNVGKTWLASQIISSVSNHFAVTAIKVSSHMHQLNDDIKLVAGDRQNWLVGLEQNAYSQKDTGRFLHAGAKQVWYAQVKSDVYLRDLIQWIDLNMDKNTPIVCESAALGAFSDPGAAIFVEGEASLKKCNWKFDYALLQSKDSRIQNLPQTIKWENNRWHIQ